MVGLLDQVRKKVISSVWKDEKDTKNDVQIDNKIALGVLLLAVAEADDRFLPEEGEKIEEVLRTYMRVSEDDMPIIMTTIEIANMERIDYHKFTREVGQNLLYQTKVAIIEDLFRVGRADGDLGHAEIEGIRKISGLFSVDHADFINAKIRVKKEFGLKTI
jgi:uncharacterized tellurite resistance protein B-like protein